MFRKITGTAESIGMKVNHAKTKLLCVADPMSFEPRGEIGEGDSLLSSGNTLKLLGFHFSEKPTVMAHVVALLKRLRSRLWILRHLREAGFNQTELVRVYTTIIRPVHDYMCVVFHPMMTDEQDEHVERIQSQALKSIFGWKIPYVELRARAGVTTLRQRRVCLLYTSPSPRD